MKVVGLDLSMAETGIAWSDDIGTGTGIIRPGSANVGDRRLVVIKRRVLDVAKDAQFVLIEGYLNRSMSAGITGMVHGAVRSALIEAGIPYATLPPTSLKKYATGRGTADKTAMALAALKRGQTEFSNNNQCDAWWLLMAALDHLGHPVISLPATNRESLLKINMEDR